MDNLWACYALFVATLFCIATLFSFYLFIVKPNNSKSALKIVKDKYNEFTPTIKFLLLLVIILIFLGFWMPFFLTRKAFIDEFDFTNTGAIGDTFGGILNPFVALAAVIVTGLAFYVQYQANQQGKDQFNEGLKRQKELFDQQIDIEYKNWLEQKDVDQRKSEVESFENQFYELLRLHKENVNELLIELDVKSASSGSNVQGRRVFVLFKSEIMRTYEAIDKIYKHKYPDHKEIFSDNLFKLSYYFFFEGLFTIYKIPNESIAQKFNLEVDFIEYLKKVLLRFSLNYKENQTKQQDLLDLNGKSIGTCNFSYQPFLGQSTRLGHYFRHLYFVVKFVAERKSELFDYSLKRYFLRILRIQLSNDEQVLLFYNWLSGYGQKWEETDLNLRREKIGNYYFTDYRMIHNLNQDYLIKGIELDKLFNIPEFKQFLFEKNRQKNDDLFEVHGYQSQLSEQDNIKMQENW
ncbi:putative phage abortive infection protein [Sphingobacterium faecium]|uniref:putative phage abortive infection protein n=1 Tax=Sphingobacterium faecium TaxID=34087 RepID=UPI00247ABD85|nr:putative phage abortive infection protein [Sphingobacterium faecium]WGQ14753.1 putative phage abortive infection protein [Sphingobacterium faecium]